MSNQLDNSDPITSMVQALKKCATTGVIALDGRSRIMVITPEAKRALDLPADFSAETLEALPPNVADALGQVMASGSPGSADLQAGSPQSPSRLYLKIAPLADNGGVVAVLFDLTGVGEHEGDFARIERLASIGSLAANMAHEVKNALVAVKTFMDLLLMQNQADELAGIVSKEMTRVDSIVSQILKIAGPGKPVFETVRLHEVLARSISAVEPRLVAKNISVNREFASSQDLIKGDRFQLAQAFSNVLLNAIDATPAEGSISVTTRSEGAENGRPDMVRTVITDRGAGIASENVARVFEPFFSTKPRSSGLGLPIARRIINEHRGTISVTSEVERGSSFQIDLPAAAGA